MDMVNIALSRDDTEEAARLLNDLTIEQKTEALRDAVSRSDLDAASLLISSGALVNLQIFCAACRHKENGEVFKYLEMFLQQHGGWDINGFMSRDFTALQVASSTAGVIEWLLDHGLDPNLECYGGTVFSNGPLTPMDVAILYERNTRMLDEMVSRGGKVTRHSLFLALPRSGGASIRVMERLLDLGADPKAVERGYGPVLHLAVRRGGYDIVRLLLERGADVHQRASPTDNREALEIAQRLGKSRIVELLQSYIQRNGHEEK